MAILERSGNFAALSQMVQKWGSYQVWTDPIKTQLFLQNDAHKTKGAN